MFGIGFWEIMALAAVGLLAFGPERLPKAALQTGRAISRLRRILRDCQSEWNAQLRRAQQGIEDSDLNRELSRIDRLMENAPDRQPQPERDASQKKD